MLTFPIHWLSSQFFILPQPDSTCLSSGLGTEVAPDHPAPEDTGLGHQGNAAHTHGHRHGSTRKRAGISWDVGNIYSINEFLSCT